MRQGIDRRSILACLPALVLAACGENWPISFSPGPYNIPFRTPEPDNTIIYKTVPSGDPLVLHLFLPAGWKSVDQRSAIIFFFGGGWRTGSPVQFYQHCRYLADRGMVAASAAYRTTGSHGVTPYESVRDAKSAVRFLRQHTIEFGVQSDHIVTAGASAGGHLAVSTALIPGYEDEISSVGSQPDAMVLFSPVLDLDKQPYHLRLGSAWRNISPRHHIRSGLPPAILLHGTADVEAPYEDAVAFTARMQQAGNDCTLVSWKDKGHSWYFDGQEPNRMGFRETLRAADYFLIEHGFLSGEPTI